MMFDQSLTAERQRQQQEQQQRQATKASSKKGNKGQEVGRVDDSIRPGEPFIDSFVPDCHGPCLWLRACIYLGFG
jgi:hypothetical protein